MKDEPLEGSLHYILYDRSYLDRDSNRPDLLPEKLPSWRDFPSAA